MAREFYGIIEKDEDGYFVGEVPQLKGCYSQGKSLDEFMENIKEVIELCLEEEDTDFTPRFVGIRRVEFLGLDVADTSPNICRSDSGT